MKRSSKADRVLCGRCANKQSSEQKQRPIQEDWDFHLRVLVCATRPDKVSQPVQDPASISLVTNKFLSRISYQCRYYSEANQSQSQSEVSRKVEQVRQIRNSAKSEMVGHREKLIHGDAVTL